MLKFLATFLMLAIFMPTKIAESQELIALDRSLIGVVSPKSEFFANLSKNSKDLVESWHRQLSSLQERGHLNSDPKKQIPLLKQCIDELRDELTSREFEDLCRRANARIITKYGLFASLSVCEHGNDLQTSLTVLNNEFSDNTERLKSQAVQETLSALSSESTKRLKTYLGCDEFSILFQVYNSRQIADTLRGTCWVKQDERELLQQKFGELRMYRHMPCLELEQFAEYLASNREDTILLPHPDDDKFPAEPVRAGYFSLTSRWTKERLNTLFYSSLELSHDQVFDVQSSRPGWALDSQDFSDRQSAAFSKVLQKELLPIQYYHLLRVQFVSDGPVVYFWRPAYAEYFEVSSEAKEKLRTIGQEAATRLEANVKSLSERFVEELYENFGAELRRELKNRFCIDHDTFVGCFSGFEEDKLLSYQDIKEPWNRSLLDSAVPDNN